MRGAKPKAGAQRRGGANDKVLAKVVEPVVTVVDAETLGVDAVPMPKSISESPARTELWRQVVGDGSAYKPEDAPLIALFVTWMDTAEQITHAMTNEQGGVLITVDGKPGPFLRQLDLATKNVLKLADQLGCNPLARARLGLTEAASMNLSLNINDRINRAIERKRG